MPNEDLNLLTKKVSVHTTPYITRRGYQCLKYSQYFVFAGFNPRGPRGGTIGNCVDGERVAGPFRDKAAAHAAACRIAEVNGWYFQNK